MHRPDITDVCFGGEEKHELKARSRHARLPRTKLERKVNKLRHDLGIGPATLLSCSRRDGPGRPANTASTGAENVHGRGDVFQCLPQLRQPINRARRAGASQGCGSHLYPIPLCIGCQANQCSCVPRGVPFLVGQWAVQKAKRQTARSKSGASQKPVCRVPP